MAAGFGAVPMGSAGAAQEAEHFGAPLPVGDRCVCPPVGFFSLRTGAAGGCAQAVPDCRCG
ncbi:hypothetical protein Ga0074812_116103 [Parafrankia irregularis]|uniref:Uncharacterized protein n=1 Tax=Parafrankia irregularis TaxID=795642 RepID=A0A0S4QS77_9ACTN|nr:hypothetical protein Ga0074812_116103 [Parafrankia irregularis]